MKIEVARKILKKHNCQIPKNSSEARSILDCYDRKTMSFCDEEIDHETEREIYNALLAILRSEIDKQLRADHRKWVRRQSAKDRKRKCYWDWKS